MNVLFRVSQDITYLCVVMYLRQGLQNIMFIDNRYKVSQVYAKVISAVGLFIALALFLALFKMSRPRQHILFL